MCGDTAIKRFQVRSTYPQVCKPGIKLSEITERVKSLEIQCMERAWLLWVCLTELLEFFEQVNKPVDKGDLANIVCLDLWKAFDRSLTKGFLGSYAVME